MSKIDITGHRFGRLQVISFVSYDRTSHTTRWACLCDCGKTTECTRFNLVRKKSQSCGCYNIECLKARGKHWESRRTKEYRSWTHMRARCHNPTDAKYYRYGGRGIKICDRWLNSYESFLEDMGRAPSPKHSIDRIDNDGPYSPENCRWATAKEQANNRSKPIRKIIVNYVQ